MGGEAPENHTNDPSEPISPDEFILKRVPSSRPGGVKSILDRPGIGLTATSFAIGPRPNEKFPSWSREKITTPIELLEIARNQGQEIDGWHVVAVEAVEIFELGLNVVPEPTPEDPGHCLIKPTDQQRFTDKLWSKLAKRTRVIYTHEA